ncbi:MAG: hypothetical protein Phyf2KO_24210 [Phycisphaerales bacterium]
MGTPPNDDSVLRNLGRFTGEIWRAIKTPANTSEKHEVSRTTETEEKQTKDGKVTVRRTTIEEIEIEKDPE